MERFFRDIEHCGIEIIIFDTPSLLGLSDTSILASKVDGTLIVTDVTKAKKEQVSKVKAVLAQSGTNVIGCIANKVITKQKTANYTSASQRKRNQHVEASKSNRAINVLSTPVLPTTPAPIPVYKGNGHPVKVLPTFSQGH